MMFEVCRSRALDKTNLFLLAFLHACYWFGISFWEKAITKKKMAILMKETQIKTSSLSLTLERGNKILARSIMFLLSEKTRTQNKRWAGFNNNLDFDDFSDEYPELSVYWMILAGKLNTPKTYFHSRKSLFYFLFILLHGFSLIEDFNNFRLCGSAASHANTKLPAAKYMTRKFDFLKSRNQLSISDSDHEKINK